MRLLMLGVLLFGALSHDALAENAAADQQWGDLSGEFIYDGTPPQQALVNVPGRVPFPDESLIVDAKTGGIANLVVYLRATVAKPVRPIHPDYEKAEVTNADAKLNVLATFDPHVLLMRTSQTLVVKNNSGGGVDVKVDPIRNRGQDQLIEAGKSAWFNFPLAESLPCKLGSTIHPWFGGYVVVQDHPYMATTDTNGRFEIKNLPVGKWTFQFWHEQPGYIKKVWRGEKIEEWPKGRLEIDVRPGKNDLGRILTSQRLFAR